MTVANTQNGNGYEDGNDFIWGHAIFYKPSLHPPPPSLRPVKHASKLLNEEHLLTVNRHPPAACLPPYKLKEQANDIINDTINDIDD